MSFNVVTSSDGSATVSEPSSKQAIPDSVVWCFVHLLSLNALFVAQPILGKLQSNLQYFQHENFSASSVLTLIAVLFFGIPLFIQVGLLLAKLRATKTYVHCLQFTLFVYFTLATLLLQRWASAEWKLLPLGLPDFILVPPAFLAAFFLSRLYFRSGSFRQCLTLSSVSVLLFPISFLSSGSTLNVVFGVRSQTETASSRAENPIPLVMIVFDGMSGMSLLNSEHEIDSVRYPNFARLSKTSNWFRNASTVHLRTDHALPAMLSGTLPEESFGPIEADYPTNLFRLIYNSDQYEMTVFEPFTRMAPQELRRFDFKRSFVAEVADLLNVSWRLYVNITIPRELAGPAIPRAWFGLSAKLTEKQRYMKGQVVYAWDQFRTTQAEHFVESLRVSSKPSFYFLHLAVPHYPWSILPDGRLYLDNYAISVEVPGLHEEEWCDDEWPVQLCWQRNLLQMAYADRVLGRVLDKLEQIGLFDKAMIVVTSDHGLSFHAGESLRALSDATLPDLVCVPCFVKLPEQHDATVSDSSIETIDILPTIAEILELPADPRWDGHSVFSSSPGLRKTIAGPIPAVINADLPERFQHVEQLIQTFGPSGPNDQIGRLNLIPQLVDQTVDAMKSEDSEFQCTVSRGQTPPYPLDRTVHPCFLTGRIRTATPLSSPVVIAVSVNNRIAVTTRTSPHDDKGRRWTALIPPDLIDENAVVELFEVRSKDDGFSLHPIREIPINPVSADP